MNKETVLAADVYLAPGAHLYGNVTLGARCSVWYNAVLRGDLCAITVGAETNIQDCCVLHTDARHTLTIGCGCTIGHGTVLHGCAVGDNTLVGMGSTVLSGAVIGRDCLIGAGSLVPGDVVVPAGSLAYGNPVHIIRPLSEREIEANRMSARQYRTLAEKADAEQISDAANGC